MVYDCIICDEQYFNVWTFCPEHMVIGINLSVNGHDAYSLRSLAKSQQNKCANCNKLLDIKASRLQNDQIVCTDCYYL